VVIPPVGQYNPDLYTIAENTKLEQEDDPDLRIEKPGFNIGQVRFKPKMAKKSTFLNISIISLRGFHSNGAQSKDTRKL